MENQMMNIEYNGENMSGFLKYARGLLLVFVPLILYTFALVPHTSAAVLKKPPNNLGLVGYWSMNEGTSTVAGDFSGNGNSGTLTNMASPPTATSGWTSQGKRGNALNFDGVDDKVSFSGVALTNTNTVAMWIYPTDLNIQGSAFGTLFSQDTTNGLFYRFGGNTIRYISSGADSNTSITANTWHHVAVTSNAGSVTYYLDGVADGTASGATGYTADSMGSDTNLDTFDGKIDEVRVYNRVLTAAEVQYLYKSGATQFKAPSNLGLVGYWSMNEGTSTIAGDFSGKGNSGTLTNMAFPATATSGWGNGKLGKGLNFDGVDDVVDTNKSLSNFITPSDGTMSAWIRPTGSVVDQSFAYYLPTVVGDAFGYVNISRGKIGGVDKIWAYSYDGNDDHVGVTYDVDKWVHIVWVHTGGTLSIYKNGVFAGSVASGNTGNLTTSLAIGRGFTEAFPDNSEYFKGAVDDVRVYNRALSAAEVAGLYQNSKYAAINTSQNNKITNGLVGMWSFNGPDLTTTTAFDRSGQGNNGTLTNGPVPAIGKVGQALSFDGVNDYVNVNSAASLIATGNATVSLWFKPSADFATGAPGDALQTQFSLADAPSTNDIKFMLNNTNGKLDFRTSFPEDILSSTATSWRANVWYHIVGVLDTGGGGGRFLYINGALDNSNSTNTRGSVVATLMSIGIELDPNFHFAGLIDEVRIYNRALSAAEVKQLYNLGK